MPNHVPSISLTTDCECKWHWSNHEDALHKIKLITFKDLSFRFYIFIIVKTPNVASYKATMFFHFILLLFVEIVSLERNSSQHFLSTSAVMWIQYYIGILYWHFFLVFCFNRFFRFLLKFWEIYYSRKIDCTSLYIEKIFIYF